MSDEMIPKKSNHCWFENGFQNHWWLKSRSLLETWFGVCLMRLGKVTPSNGSTTPHRQMSSFENRLVMTQNANSHDCFQKERFQTMLLWNLFVTSLVVSKETTPRGVSLTWLGKVTPSDGFGRPCRQKSKFENGLVVPENATSEQLRELPLWSSLARSLLPMGFCKPVANCQTWKILWWWHQTQCLMKWFPKNPTIVDLKTVFKIIGGWKADRSSKLGSVSVWCGLARSLLPMVLRHPIAKCQALKIAWWWHKKQTLMIAFKKNGSKQCCSENCL